MSKRPWIAMAKELPPEGIEVETLDKARSIGRGRRVARGKLPAERFAKARGMGFIVDVTHWRPVDDSHDAGGV